MEEGFLSEGGFLLEGVGGFLFEDKEEVEKFEMWATEEDKPIKDCCKETI